MTRGITDISVVYISIFSNSQLMSVINTNNNISGLQFMSVFMWVDILSSLVIYWTTSDDVYLHRRGRGANLYMVSGK